MGKIFDDLSYATPKHLYVGAPVDEIKALNAQKSQDYQTNKLENDKLEIALNNLDIRDVDYDLKKKKIQEHLDSVKDIVKNGDWQNAKFQIQQQVKKFTTDKEIQAMQQAKQAQQAHFAEIDKEVEENKKSKEWADYEKAISHNSAIKTNPDGTISGGYAANKVLNDKEITQQIAKEAETFINDYKADKFQIGGNSYQSAGNGQYFVNGTTKTVGFDEVKQGLVQELKNRHGDFLQQEKAVHMFNVKKGEDRPLNFSDLSNSFGIKDKEDLLKKFGADEETLNQLKKDPRKNAELIKLAERQKNEIQSVLQKPDGIDRIYNTIFDTNQENKYTNPYANKAAYREDEQKWELNHFALENLKAANERANMKFKGELEKQAIVPLVLTNNSELHSYTATDLGLTENQINLNKQELAKKESLIKQIENDPSRARELDKLKQETKYLKQTIDNNTQTKADYIENISAAKPELQNSYLAHSIVGKNNSAGLAAFILANKKDFSKATVDAALNLNTNMSKDALEAHKVNKSTFDLQSQIGESDFLKLQNAINIDKNKNKILNEAVRIVEEKGNDLQSIRFKNREWEEQAKKEAKNPSPFSNVGRPMPTEAMKEYKNPNLVFSQVVEDGQAPIVEQSKKVFAIDRNTDISSKNNTYIELMTDLVKNGSSTFLKDGMDYGKYITNLIDNNELKDAHGKPIKDLDQSKVTINPVINYFTGIPQARVNLPNAYLKGKEGQLVTANLDFDAADSEATSAYFKQMGNELLNSSKPEDRQKGIEINSYLQFGKDLARLNTAKESKLDVQRTIKVPYIENGVKKEGDKTLKIVKKEGQEGINVYNLDGSPVSYKDNKNGEFSSIQELEETLYKKINNL